jgi:hypothetical protein
MLTPTLISMVLVSSLTALFVLPFGMALATGGAALRSGSAQARSGSASARPTAHVRCHLHDKRRGHADRRAAPARRIAPGSSALSGANQGAREKLSRAHLERNDPDRVLSTPLS